MANVNFGNSDIDRVDLDLQQIASSPPQQYSETALVFGRARGSLYLQGTGFGFDPQGLLVAGTITYISSYTPLVGNGLGANGGSATTITDIALPAATLRDLLATGQSPTAVLLAGKNTYTVGTDVATGSPSDDLFIISSGRTNLSFAPFVPPIDRIRVAVDGGGGQNTASFAALRSDATIAGGGGNEKVSYRYEVTLQLVDKLTFLDGTTYETNASAGAQAALMFEGIFGRLPDAINAGGFAEIAEQSGRLAAAAAMLQTPEASGATSGLGNAAFVTRLYQNMLHRAPEAAGLAGWQASLDTGQLTRADVVTRFADGVEAQIVAAPDFTAGAVFAAKPLAVEVLRAYETLLNRAPERAALVFDIGRLEGGLSLEAFYTEVQRSAEFASTPNPYGITASTSYAAVYGIAHADQVNGVVGPLVTSGGGVAHL